MNIHINKLLNKRLKKDELNINIETAENNTEIEKNN